MPSDAGWPRLGWEQRSWAPRISPSLVSATVRRRHSGPYRAAVVPHIARLVPHIRNAALALAEDASAEIARFDAEVGRELAPFAAVLLRSESASSSMIENLTSGAKAIALAELGSTEKRNATEVVANVAAMRAALDLADRLDAKAILAMHSALMNNVEPGMAGQWRQEQVWIGGTTFGPHDASFVPPHHEHVPALVDDLVAFTRRTDVPLLVRTAISHAQFETIHPFPDGNGRTGRALIHAMLRGHGLTRNVTFPVSAGLLTDTYSYFETLNAYREGEPTAIVTKLAEASFAAAANGRELVAELHTVRADWNSRIKARAGASAWRLADMLLSQPVVDATTVASALSLAAGNVQRSITPLVDAGILTEFTGFKRNRMWQAGEVLSALDEFAARAGRRVD
jgi:Fic family protein